MADMYWYGVGTFK